MEQYLTVTEISKRLRVHEMTIRLWVRQGLIVSQRVGTRALRISESEIERFMRVRNIPKN